MLDEKKNLMIRFLTVLIILYTLGFSGCSHSVDVGPITPKLKDPKTYTWTIDTLLYHPYPQYTASTMITSIRGINDTLIFATGEEEWNGRGAMWKHNGTQWERVKLFSFEGGVLTSPFAFNSVNAFSENDIYAFGDAYTNKTGSWVSSGLAIHFDGTRWEKIPLPKGGAIHSAISPNPSQIYCGGREGSLYYFNGKEWSLDTIKSMIRPDLEVFTTVVSTTIDNAIYLEANENDPKTGQRYFQFIKYKDKKTTILDSSVNVDSWGGLSFWKSSSGKIYSCGSNGIYRFTGEKWQKFASLSRMYSIYGLNDEHIFALGSDQLYFYDGQTWSSIYTFNDPSIFIARIWCSENQIFVAFTNGYLSYVLRGK
ncbi:MAG TPA: hypothetical protein VK470_16750 [Bacteroidota bacterium]|nr:hypothetical protein [Bacteroidota bacterium]